MGPLPPARARVHGVGGEAERAGAVVRHAVRRAGALAVATAKVVLWLGVVIASLIAIGSLGKSRQPRYPDLEALRRSTAEIERNRRALDESLRNQQLVDDMLRDLQHRDPTADFARRALAPPPPPHHHR
jgi:hypothetical protein